MSRANQLAQQPWWPLPGGYFPGNNGKWYACRILGVCYEPHNQPICKKRKETIRFLNKKQGVKQNPKNRMKNAFKNLLFSIASIIAMLQSMVELPFVSCDQCTKESEKKKYFWVSCSFFAHKKRRQKTLNLTIKRTSIPKKTPELPNNQPESFPSTGWRK